MADGKPKVVPFKPGAHSSGGSAQSLPQSLLRVQERLVPQLQQLMQHLFDQADDALFELADRAASNLEQNVFFESMREVRIRRRAIERGMARRMEEGLQALVYSRSDAPQLLEVGAVPVSELALVEHEELEQLVAADSMAAKGEKQYAELLQTLTLRLDTLAVQQKVTLKTNPLAPASLCQFFIDECQPLAIDIKAKLVLFKLFDRQVMAQLEPFYQQANAMLVAAGILPGLTASDLVRQPDRRAQTHQEGVEGEQIFAQLSQLLDPVRKASRPFNENKPYGLVAPGAAPSLARDTLMQLLAEVQRRQTQQLMVAPEQLISNPAQLDVLRSINHLLEAVVPDRPVSLGQQDDDVIQLVSMLFQFMLEDRNLPVPVKGLLARLQIPVLRLAMQDKSVFSRAGHPARTFLNEVATASLGWTPTGPLEKDPFYCKVEALVDRILGELDGGVALFQEVLADFVSFVEQERRRASLVERRTIDAEDGRVRAEAARATVQQALDERVAGRTLPRAMVRLLEEGWSHVLFLTCLREGTQSQAWREAMATVDELLESVRPTVDAAERTLLIRRLPGLLKQLRTGLTKIGFNPHEMNQLFADLEKIHLSRLQPPESKAPVEDSAQAAMEAPDLAQLDQELDAILAASPLESGEGLAQTSSPSDASGLPQDGGAVTSAEATVEAAGERNRLDTGNIGAQETETEPAQVAAVSESQGMGTAMPKEEGESATAIDAPWSSGAEAVTAMREAIETEKEQVPEPSLASKARVQALRTGCWVEFRGDDQRVTRCRLAAVIQATGKYIFVSRAGIKVAEETVDSLARLLDRGQVEFLDDGQLFDRALESVIGSLREMQRGR